MARFRCLKYIVILLIPFLLIGVLYKIEDWLLNIGVLNKKDLGFVGDESGTFYEYITNIWYWDAALLLLTILAVLASLSIFLIILHRKMRAKNEARKAKAQGGP
ncbi:MAG: hypothetical protein ACXU9K_03215 [Thermodesulfobacteriota bacterium]